MNSRGELNRLKNERPFLRGKSKAKFSSDCSPASVVKVFYTGMRDRVDRKKNKRALPEYRYDNSMRLIYFFSLLILSSSFRIYAETMGNEETELIHGAQTVIHALGEEMLSRTSVISFKGIGFDLSESDEKMQRGLIDHLDNITPGLRHFRRLVINFKNEADEDFIPPNVITTSLVTRDLKKENGLSENEKKKLSLAVLAHEYAHSIWYASLEPQFREFSKWTERARFIADQQKKIDTSYQRMGELLFECKDRDATTPADEINVKCTLSEQFPIEEVKEILKKFKCPENPEIINRARDHHRNLRLRHDAREQISSLFMFSREARAISELFADTVSVIGLNDLKAQARVSASERDYSVIPTQSKSSVEGDIYKLYDPTRYRIGQLLQNHTGSEKDQKIAIEKVFNAFSKEIRSLKIQFDALSTGDRSGDKNMEVGLGFTNGFLNDSLVKRLDEEFK